MSAANSSSSSPQARPVFWECTWLALVCLVLAKLSQGLDLKLDTSPVNEWVVQNKGLTLTILVWVCYLVLFPLARMSWGRRLDAQRPIHPVAFPGWVLFTGLGSLWLLDYSANSYQRAQSMGIEHLKHVAFAYAGLIVGTRFGPAFFDGLAKWAAKHDRASQRGWRSHAGPLVFIVVCLAGAALLSAVVFQTQLPFIDKLRGSDKPPMAFPKWAETTRLLACMSAGWALYRWGSSLSRHAWRALFGAVFAGVIGLLGLGLIFEWGQLQVLGYTAAILAGAVTALLGRPLWGLLLGIGVAMTLVLATQGILRSPPAWLAERVPSIPARAEAVNHRYTGQLDYLSRLRWFAHDAPTLGHGLGHVPWCSALSDLKQTGICDGVPAATHADYVFAALSAVWGWPGALLITGALALWLLSLIDIRALSSGSAGSGGLLQGFGLFFITSTLMTLLITSLASVGAIVLTGINYPLLGGGGTNLLVTSTCLGMLMHRQRIPKRATPRAHLQQQP